MVTKQGRENKEQSRRNERPLKECARVHTRTNTHVHACMQVQWGWGEVNLKAKHGKLQRDH